MSPLSLYIYMLYIYRNSKVIVFFVFLCGEVSRCDVGGHV